MHTPTRLNAPVPPIACTLDREQLAGRLEAARSLGATALTGAEIAGRRAVLVFEPGHPELDEFVEAERSCCAFLSLSTRSTGRGVELEIDAPEGAEVPLRSLAAALIAGWEGAL